MSMGTAISGGMKRFLELALEHTSTRKQFDRHLIDFEMVEEKLAWMAGEIYGLESGSYLTTGLVDRAESDFSLESAMTKIAASDQGWYALNRAFQLLGGEAYMAKHPLAKALRDFRIFPIFEGSNDVMRAYVALNGIKALSEDLPDVANLKITNPFGAIGELAPYVQGKFSRAVRPEKLEGAHPAFAHHVQELAGQTVRLRDAAEAALRKHGKKVQEKQLIQRRLADAASGIYSQTAVISRATAVFQRDGDKISGAEKTVAMNFLKRTQREVNRQFRGLEINDDKFVAQIADGVKQHRGYPFDL
jgi:acyl-CoA dehydrogenase family protein 9